MRVHANVFGSGRLIFCPIWLKKNLSSEEHTDSADTHQSIFWTICGYNEGKSLVLGWNFIKTTQYNRSGPKLSAKCLNTC